MLMTRLKRVTGLALDPELLDRLEAWRLSQDVPPTKTACMETAIREFLKSREDGPKKGRPEFGWRQFQSPPIQHEAAKRIEELEAALWIALDGREIVVHEGVGCGRIEFITMDDGRTLVRRARETI